MYGKNQLPDPMKYSPKVSSIFNNPITSSILVLKTVLCGYRNNVSLSTFFTVATSKHEFTTTGNNTNSFLFLSPL